MQLPIEPGSKHRIYIRLTLADSARVAVSIDFEAKRVNRRRSSKLAAKLVTAFIAKLNPQRSLAEELVKEESTLEWTAGSINCGSRRLSVAVEGTPKSIWMVTLIDTSDEPAS